MNENDTAVQGADDAPHTLGPIHLSRRQVLIGAALSVVAGSLLTPFPARAVTIWGHPFATHRAISSGYGARDGGFHHGIDYPLAGTPRPDVHAVSDGVVFDQGWHSNFGNFVEIRHDNGWSSYYAHLLSPSDLRRTNAVKRGDVVGTMGNTGGASRGDHLHVELRTEPGVWNATINPENYIHSALLPSQASNPFREEDDEMLALKITNGSATYSAILGPGIFRSLLSGDNPDRVKNLLRIQDDWQTIELKELPIYLRTFGCDLHIWDVRNGVFVVRDPLDGSIAAGNVWTATGEIRAALARLTTVS